MKNLSLVVFSIYQFATKFIIYNPHFVRLQPLRSCIFVWSTNEKQMFSKISWSVFLLSLAGLLGAYYLVIGFLFYRKDFRSWIAHRRPARVENGPMPEETRSEGHPDTELFRDTDRAGDPSA